MLQLFYKFVFNLQYLLSHLKQAYRMSQLNLTLNFKNHKTVKHKLKLATRVAFSTGPETISYPHANFASTRIPSEQKNSKLGYFHV